MACLLPGCAWLTRPVIDIRGELRHGRDVFIDVGCVFEGKVELGDAVEIGPYCVLKNVKVGAGTRIAAFCHFDNAEIGPDGVLGPYARLRPGTRLGPEVHIGNFVEVKNSSIGAQSKANHLAYIGDAEIGQRVNVGAGTITCNYDGANKFKTIIEDDVFIGSDTQLVAPVTVGRGATLGAGTTLTKNAPPDALTVSRAKQNQHFNRVEAPGETGNEKLQVMDIWFTLFVTTRRRFRCRWWGTCCWSAICRFFPHLSIRAGASFCLPTLLLPIIGRYGLPENITPEFERPGKQLIAAVLLLASLLMLLAALGPYFVERRWPVSKRSVENECFVASVR
jgi:acetyltransferase-like isoleucine patch superfamily enzyme